MPGLAGPGLHVRAGNAMGRTRDGLLDGALASIERDGLRRLTMSGICARSGVAKATLYNHFRTKPDVLAALVWREVDRVADAALASAASGGLAAALAGAADRLAGFAAGRVVAASEPGVLVGLLTTGDGPGWAHARERAAGVLGADPGHPLVDLTLVWLGSVLLAPPPATARQATAALLAQAAEQARPSRPPEVAEVTGGSTGDLGEPVTAGMTGTST